MRLFRAHTTTSLGDTWRVSSPVVLRFGTAALGLFGIVGFVPHSTASTLISEVTTDSAGRTLSLVQGRSLERTFSVLVQNVPAAEKEQYSVRYRLVDEVSDPHLLSFQDPLANVDIVGEDKVNLQFSIPVERKEMLIYNIWKRKTSTYLRKL